MPHFFQLNGQIALVTGGAQGIGAGIARRLHSAGAAVAVFDRDADLARSVASELHGLALKGDVTVEQDVAAALDQVQSTLGPISILVNNAGITGRSDLSWNLSLKEFREVLDVNLLGTFLFCRGVVPGMLERGYGRIVNIASISGKEGNPAMLPYSASKAAVIALTKSLGKELAGKANVTVNAIAPGVVQTALLDALTPSAVQYMIAKIPMGRTGTIDEVAALVHYLASPEASFTTGQCYDLSGGRATY